MEDALAVVVSQALAGRTINDGATLCGVPDHQLRDVVYKRSRRPSPSLLAAISRGLGISYEQLALAAYGIVANGEAQGVGDTATDGPHPSDAEDTWARRPSSIAI